MSLISQAVNHFPNFQPLSQSQSFSANTNQLQFRSQTQTSTNFSFVTAEGDRVSVSSGSKENTSLDTYTFQGFAEGQAVSFQSQQFNTSIEQNFNLLIEGDLNEQEQADIQEFLNSAKSIFQELAEGNTEEATKTAAALGNLDSLSQAALFVRQATSVSVATQSTRVAIQEGTGLNEASRRAQSEPRRVGTLDQILEKIRDAQERLQIDPDKLVNRLPTLATSLLKSLEDDVESTDSPPSILKQLQKEFLESLLESTKNINPQQDSEETLTDRPTPPEPVFPSNTEELPRATSPQLETTQI